MSNLNTNIFCQPKLIKLILNVNVGLLAQNKNYLLKLIEAVQILTLQKPCITSAKKSISNFKLKSGTPLGVFVTLRRLKLKIFLEKFILLSLPSIRDFKGLSNNNFDKRGNLNLGLTDMTIFPELYNHYGIIPGCTLTFNIINSNPIISQKFLTNLGIPFLKN